MSEEQPKDIEEPRTSELGVLTEAEEARRRALTEDIPGYMPGETAEEAAWRLEAERYGTPDSEVPEPEVVVAKPRRRRRSALLQ